LLYLIQSRRHGAHIVVDDAVVSLNFVVNTKENLNKKVWKIVTKSGSVFHSNFIINCAGLYGDKIDEMGRNTK
jgi:L-2-hydroxyglutarate oxidase LhgO